MPKRFTDSEKWEDPWFCSLRPREKLFWIYLLDRCDHGGIWKVNWPMAEFHLGKDIDELEILARFSTRIQVITPEKWFVPNFIRFQQPSGLNPANKVHASIIKILTFNKISLSPFQAPSKGLARGYSNSNSNSKKGGAGGKIQKYTHKDPFGDSPEEIKRQTDIIRNTYKKLKENANRN